MCTTTPHGFRVGAADERPAMSNRDEANNICQYFVNITEGSTSTLQTLIDDDRNTFAQLSGHFANVARSTEAVIGITDTTRQMRAAKVGKGSGPTLIPSELCHLLPKTMARLYDTLILKANLSLFPPKQMERR